VTEIEQLRTDNAALTASLAESRAREVAAGAGGAMGESM